MDVIVGRGRTSRSTRRGAAAVLLAFALAVLAFARPAGAAGINFSEPFGQRFVGSASAPKSIPVPLATTIGPIRSLAVAGVNATTFSPIKDPVLGITIFSSSQVKQIVLDTLAAVPDTTKLAFKVNSLAQSDPTDFTLGGNCLGADGNTTALCIATLVFKPTTPGAKTDTISPTISITAGMPQLEAALRTALTKQGVTGTILSIIEPLISSSIQSQLTSGIQGALLTPLATATGTGVAGPFTDPAVFVRRQYADFAAGTPSSSTVSSWLAKFEANTTPATLVDTLRKGGAWDGHVGPVTRLYSAYFLRSPDRSGLDFWVSRHRRGQRLRTISSTFAASHEFTRRYGDLDNAGFASLVYRNVLGRKPDSSGLAYWTRQLDEGQTRGSMMVGFSESSEYVRKQQANVTTVEIWYGMLHRAPTPTELTGYAARIAGGTPATTIITEVLASTEYRTVVLG